MTNPVKMTKPGGLCEDDVMTKPGGSMKMTKPGGLCEDDETRGLCEDDETSEDDETRGARAIDETGIKLGGSPGYNLCLNTP